MVGYNLFQTSTLGMRSNTHALNTIGANIANVNTGGYKRTDTRFETVLSQTIGGNHSDVGGVKPKDYQTITQQGIITSSSRDLDLAIVGNGFYQLSNSLTSFDDENLFYSRDGAFRVEKSENVVTATGEGGDTIQTNEGYLVDKNGYYLLGWSPETDGSFLESGTPRPMRIDTYAFATDFQTTTTAKLSLNLPSNAEIISDHAATVLTANAGTNNENLQTYTISVVDSNGAKRDATINFTKSANNQWEVSATTSRANTPQTDTLVLQGTVEAGDTYSVTINNNTVSYTTTGAEADLAAVRTAVVAAINANTVVGNRVTATAGVAPGEITLTENAGTTTPQIETVTIAGTVETGDVYEVNVGGALVTYTTTMDDATLSDVRDALLAKIATDPSASAIVTASAGAATGEIVLTAVTSGTAFTTTVNATNVTSGTADNTASTTTTQANDDGTTLTTTVATTNVGAVSQVDTITLAGTIETGDIYSVTINGTAVSYTALLGDTLADVRNGLVVNINGDATANAIVVATAGGTGEVILTASAAGNTLTTSATASDGGGGTLDNTATLVTTTAAVAVTDDSGIAIGTNTNYQTSAIQSLSFTELGQINGVAPITLDYSFTFDDAATATVALDVTDFTQYGDSFLPFNYSHNGLAVANLGRITFDQVGHVLGDFDDGTQRNIYKLPLTTFTNPNGLEVLNGMVFKESADSGTAITYAADTSGLASFTPYSLEVSNVDIAEEFAKMIMVQNAYNSNATVFKTVDEMVSVARDLKA